MQTAEDLVLHLELGRHGELGAFLDLEGLVLQGGLASGGGEVDRDGRAAGGVHGQGQDNADPGVIGVGNILAATEAEGLLVALQRLIAGILVQSATCNFT